MTDTTAEITNDDLHKMQRIGLELLIEVDRVCKRHGIAYSLYGGSLLGAVRHGGFIPWDDDVDICMLREDYDRFVSVCDELDPAICYLQCHATEPEYRWGYAKVRRVGTSFVTPGQSHLNIRTGIFLDIFPLDDIPRALPAQMLQDLWCFFLRKITWSESGKHDPRSGALERVAYRALSRIPVDWAFRRERAMANKSRSASPNRLRTLFWPAPGKDIVLQPLRERYGMPKEWFTELEDMDFEGLKVPGSRHAHEYLTYQYGDYMTPPTQADQTAHDVVHIDLGSGE